MAQMQRCEVLRGFQHRREIQGPGTVLDLDVATANELRTANKVKFVHNETPRTHNSTLPDSNRVLALRAQARAALLATPATAAEVAAAGAGDAGGKGTAKTAGGK